MKLIIVNNTNYEQIKIVSEYAEKILYKNEKIILDEVTQNITLEILVLDKNQVLFNFIFALLDGVIGDEHLVNSLNCHANFDIEIISNDNIQTLVLTDFEVRDDKNQFIYNSVFVEAENIIVHNYNYYLSNIQKEKNKSTVYYLLFSSWLPIIIFFIGCFFCSGNILVIIAALLFFCIFTIPSIIKIKKMKILYSDIYVNELFLHKIQSPIASKKDNIIGRVLYKIFKNKR